MKRIALIALLLAGCKHAPTISEGLAAASVALHGVAVGAEVEAERWTELIDARIAHCKAQDLPDTPEARAQCMGVYGQGAEVEDDLEIIRDGYDAVAEGLERMRKAAKRLEARTAGETP